jgi:hypothetical protein
VAIYMDHNPAKLSDVRRLMLKHRLLDLYLAICGKYDVQPYPVRDDYLLGVHIEDAEVLRNLRITMDQGTLELSPTGRVVLAHGPPCQDLSQYGPPRTYEMDTTARSRASSTKLWKQLRRLAGRAPSFSEGPGTARDTNSRSMTEESQDSTMEGSWDNPAPASSPGGMEFDFTSLCTANFTLARQAQRNMGLTLRFSPMADDNLYHCRKAWLKVRISRNARVFELRDILAYKIAKHMYSHNMIDMNIALQAYGSPLLLPCLPLVSQITSEGVLQSSEEGESDSPTLLRYRTGPYLYPAIHIQDHPSHRWEGGMACSYCLRHYELRKNAG